MSHMRPMNRASSRILAALTGLLLACSCQNLSLTKAGRERSIPAVIHSIGGNDLGRIIVFAETKDRTQMVFVRDIYSSSGSPADVKRKMREYIDSIKNYQGRKVIISYYENSIGDLMITGIRKQ